MSTRSRTVILAFAAGLAACSLTADLGGLSGAPDSSPSDGGDATTASEASPPTDAGPDGTVVPVTGWRFRKRLTIDKASVPTNSDLIGFPILVSVTDPDLRKVESGGSVQTGSDIAFFSGDGMTPLAHEIEQYSPVTGHLIAWVKLPVLSGTSGTTLYMHFGNAEVTSTLEDRPKVWSEGFGGVWHMADVKWTDSARSNHGTPAGGAQSIAAGMIGGGGSFGATNSNVNVGSDPSLQPTSITVSVWAQPQSIGTAPDRHPYMATQDTYRAPGSDPRGYYIEIYRTQTNPSPTFYTGNAATIAHAFATTDVVNGTWYYVVGTRDEVTGVTRIYVDGSEQGSATMTGPIKYDAAKPLLLGGVGSETWNGALDELRIASVARSAGWIATEHANQRSPETFVTFGNREALP